MPFVAFLHEIPHPIWVVAIVLGFIVHWPIGLAVLLIGLAFGCVGRGRYGRAYGYAYGPAGAGGGCGPVPGGFSSKDEFRQWKRELKRNLRENFRAGWSDAPRPSGNSAFEDYRAETLRRLEEEQKEFQEYLERLRRARDKSEFDSFMADRGRHDAPPSPQG